MFIIFEMFKIMDLIPKFIKNLFKYVIGYLCILLCINCKEKCIDDEPTPTETLDFIEAYNRAGPIKTFIN